MPGFNVGKSLPGCNLQYGSDVNNVLSNSIETSRSNRFRLSIISPPTNGIVLLSSVDLVSFACESISRPTIRVEKESVYNGADYINVPLRVKYEPIEISLYEILKPGYTEPTPIENASSYNLTAEKVLQWWTNGVFSPRTSRTRYPSSRRITVEITLLSGGDVPIWSYRLYRAWPEAIIPSGMDYKTGAISKLALTVVFDKLEEIRP